MTLPAAACAALHPAHKVYPYLLRSLVITRANQVWAMEEAIAKFGVPEIFNTNQESQFTSDDVDVLNRHGIQISMDGKGRWMNNVFVEGLSLILKYEEVYLKVYKQMAESREQI